MVSPTMASGQNTEPKSKQCSRHELWQATVGKSRARSSATIFAQSGQAGARLAQRLIIRHLDDGTMLTCTRDSTIVNAFRQGIIFGLSDKDHGCAVYTATVKSEVLYDGPPRPSALVGDRRPCIAIVPFPQLLTGCGTAPFEGQKNTEGSYDFEECFRTSSTNFRQFSTRSGPCRCKSPPIKRIESLP